MDNPEKLPTQCTQDEDKQSKNIAQYVPDTTIRNQHIQRKENMSSPTNNWR